VPILLPWMIFALAVLPQRKRPESALPEMTLPAPGVAPPIVFARDQEIPMPAPALARGAEPEASQPM